MPIPSVEPRHHRGVSARRRFLDEWTPRVGPVAAEHRWRNATTRLVAAVANPTWFVLLVIGFRQSSGPLVAAGFVVAALAAGTVIASIVEIRRYFRAASAVLGVEVGPRNAPPRDQDAYEKWCGDRGLVPFAAGRS